MVRLRRMTVHTSTLVTVDEAATQFGLPPTTIHSWITRGHIRRHAYRRQNMGRPKTVIDIEELRLFLQTHPKTA